MTSQASFGDASPLRRHAGSRAKGKKWQTPAPGAYDIQASPDVKFRTASSSQFGGNLCKVNRDLTGIRADALRRASDPGPQNYSTEAGKQELDARKRAPTVKFGSAQRSGDDRVYMHKMDTTGDSSDPNRGHAGKGVPGPGAYGNVSVPLAKTRRGSPQYTFGQKVGQNGPPSATMPTIGPGAYRSASSIGPQLVSTRPSSPNFMMGSSSRAQMNTILQPGFLPDGTAKSPGPSKYDSVSGVGTQLQSKNRSANSYSFSAEDRLPRTRDKGIPGPGSYDASSTLGIQANSTYTTAGGFKFGTSQRPEADDLAMSHAAAIDGGL